MATATKNGKAAGGKTPTKSKSTSMVPWAERFAPYATAAKEQNKNIGGGGIGVKFGRGKITIGGSDVKGGRLECVVLGSCGLNKWYEKDYNPNEATPPDCYAFALMPGDPDMAPHKQAAKKQSADCASCEKNQFGTANTGRGKACSNTVRLAVITAKDAEDVDEIASAEIATAGVSPTNTKAWKTYVDMLADEHGVPPWGAVTEISSHDDPVKQIRLEFRLVDLIVDGSTLDALEKRVAKIQDLLQTPFQAVADRPTTGKPAGASGKFAGKAARR